MQQVMDVLEESYTRFGHERCGVVTWWVTFTHIRHPLIADPQHVFPVYKAQSRECVNVSSSDREGCVKMVQNTKWYILVLLNLIGQCLC